ncbi:MAG: hypothetical protein NWE98_03830 [Candidatus Bathyarchaeota archaeon]|nr:hypothetical protein [Candidatus Bathyarchaeota archaeon]
MSRTVEYSDSSVAKGPCSTLMRKLLIFSLSNHKFDFNLENAAFEGYNLKVIFTTNSSSSLAAALISVMVIFFS